MRHKLNVVENVKAALLETIEGKEDIAGAVVGAMTSTTVKALHGTRVVGAELLELGVETVRGGVRAVAEVGGELGDSAKFIMLGALNGANQVGKATLEGVTANAEALVKTTADVGGSSGAAAKGAIEGAMMAARDLGLDLEAAAEAAATGALRAAGKVGGTAVTEVEHVVGRSVSSAKAMLETSVGSRRRR